MFRCLCGLLVIGLVAASGLRGSAQEMSGAREFGAGMHNFYQGRHFEAIRHFDAALVGETRDPRVYFFRGLAKQRLGWTADADIDFRLGAQLEVALKRRDIGMALQRIQGSERLLIERYRREARQLPEAVVRNVLPQPSAAPRAAATVQQAPAAPVPQATTRRQAPASPAQYHYVPSSLADDATDPFAGEANGFLGRGELQASAAQPIASSPAPEAPAPEADDPFQDDFAADPPVGSGVAAESGDELEPRIENAGTPRPSTATRGDSSGGVWGAALRALSRSMAPAAELAEQGGNLLQGARGAMAGNAAPAAPSATEDAGDLFAPSFEEPTDEAGAEPTAAPAAGAADDDPADDTGDPFADDTDGAGDPFNF